MIEKMRAVEFFNSNNQHIHKLISYAPKGLKDHQIEAAAVEVYKEIENGLQIKLQDIPRYVWRKAYNLDGHDYKKTWALSLNSRKTIERLVERSRRLRGQLDDANDELKKKNRKIESVLWDLDYEKENLKKQKHYSSIELLRLDTKTRRLSREIDELLIKLKKSKASTNRLRFFIACQFIIVIVCFELKISGLLF